ncbi:MAG: hypothetical protein MZV65_27990 [Chromatiales bacterium]|nr:hypothetical protein [Chromatiales bacterium]
MEPGIHDGHFTAVMAWANLPLSIIRHFTISRRAWSESFGELTTWTAMHWIEVVSNAAFGWFIYKTVSYYASFTVACVAAMVALFNPFLVMLHYKFHGFAWASVGYASHGLLLWSLLRPGASHHLINIPAALAIGLSIWSHTISALVNLICFSAYVLVAREESLGGWLANLVHATASWAMTVALGLALSAAYLFPALLLLDNINPVAWTGSHILQAFAWPVFTVWMHGIQWLSFQWPIALPALLLLLLSLIYIWRHRPEGQMWRTARIALAVGVCGFFCLGVVLPLVADRLALTANPVAVSVCVGGVCRWSRRVLALVRRCLAANSTTMGGCFCRSACIDICHRSCRHL